MKHVSVVIPTYNACHLLEKNLAAIFSACRTGDEVVIVNDAGTDQTHQYLIKSFALEEIKVNQIVCPPHYYPQLKTGTYRTFKSEVHVDKKKLLFTYIQLLTNLRFAGAANVGVLFATHELVFLCNNDVIPEADCIGHVLPHFEDKNTFAVGCMEYEGSQKGQQSGKNVLFFKRGLFQHNRAPEFSSGETAWASGGSAMFDKNKWLELHGFDRAYYPAYWEDIDLSFRARKRGWRIIFEAAALVYHKHESTHSDVFGAQKIAAMSWKNAQTFVWKNGSLYQKLQYIMWWPYWMLRRML